MGELIIFLLISLLIQIILFIPAFLFKTDKLTDASYSITFVIISLYALVSKEINSMKIILFTMVLIWAFRLGIFLFIRIHAMKKDSRFDGVREKLIPFLTFWLGQGIIVWVVLLPSLIYFSSIPEYSKFSILGIIIWFIGISIESIADYQKFTFKQKNKDKNKWLKSGLWNYSRHPNYFGEMLCWIGIFLFTLPTFTINSAFIGVISPLVIILLLRYGTGVPKLEDSANKRYGHLLDYQIYKRKTSLIILWPHKN